MRSAMAVPVPSCAIVALAVRLIEFVLMASADPHALITGYVVALAGSVQVMAYVH